MELREFSIDLGRHSFEDEERLVCVVKFNFVDQDQFGHWITCEVKISPDAQATFESLENSALLAARHLLDLTLQRSADAPQQLSELSRKNAAAAQDSLLTSALQGPEAPDQP